MINQLNCQEITTNIQAIRSKKDAFDKAFNDRDVETCLQLKTEISQMIKELKDKLWPFEQEELSKERLTSIYERYRSVFEAKGIVENGQIASELLPPELKEENFAMPTAGQFLEYVASRNEELMKMANLGLIEPVIVPIATDFGKDSVSGGVHNYTGLLGILAKEIQTLSQEGKLKGSDGTLLPKKSEWANKQVDPTQPVYVNSFYQNILYAFKEKDGSFSDGLTQQQFIQKHKEAGSPFPGFAIIFKEKGNLLPRDRDDSDPLVEMKANREYQQYQESLRKLGLSGTTVQTELVILLSSLQNDGTVTRDYANPNNSIGFIGGNTFGGFAELGVCRWDRVDGRFFFNAYDPGASNVDVAGVAAGELV